MDSKNIKNIAFEDGFSRGQTTWICILALLFVNSVTFDKLLNL